MAGRIRSLKPELMEDEATAALSHVAFRLFVGMILIADDHGNLRASRAWLKGQVFHHAEITDRAFDSALAELTKKLVSIYVAGEQRYAHVNGWAKHQRIDNAMSPRVPLPPGWECAEEVRAEGSRTRRRWVSREVDGAAPHVHQYGSTHTDGAAPTGPPEAGGAVQPRVRAREVPPDHRSPITDPDHRPPKPPAGREPPRLPPDHSLTALLASDPLLAGCDHGAGAFSIAAAGGRHGIDDEDAVQATVIALDGLGRALSRADGVAEPMAYVVTTATNLMQPGALEQAMARTAQRPATTFARRDEKAPASPSDIVEDFEQSKARLEAESREAVKRRVDEAEAAQRWRAEQAEKRARGEPTGLGAALPAFAKGTSDDEPQKGTGT